MATVMALLFFISLLKRFFMLSPSELLRYSRHLSLPKFGMESQQKLKEAKVLVVGTGGLGAPLLQYLTAAGVGTIGFVDFDVVDESNLQRQVLFSTEDIGKNKTEVALEKLKGLNPNIHFEVHNIRLDSSNALSVIEKYDVIADGTDNFPTRYLVNDACVLLGKTNVYASVYQFEGQVSVFNHFDGKEYGPNYRDLFPEPPPPGMVPNCAEGGVLGVLPGIIGSLQALEVIKVITGVGTSLSGFLFLFNALDFSTRKIRIRKDPANPVSGENPSIKELINYEEFCGMKKNSYDNIEVVSVEELQRMREMGEEFVLVDVREPYEHEAANIGGLLIPLNEIEEKRESIPTHRKVIFYCKSGQRSGRAVELLQNKFAYTNLLNLEGGIVAWKEEIDHSLHVI